MNDKYTAAYHWLKQLERGGRINGKRTLPLPGGWAGYKRLVANRIGVPEGIDPMTWAVPMEYFVAHWRVYKHMTKAEAESRAARIYHPRPLPEWDCPLVRNKKEQK